MASESKQSLESQAADVDEQATAASSRQDRRRGRPALASESKRSVESWAGIGTNGHDGWGQTTAANNRTDGEDNGRKREQAVESQAADVDEQATAASSRQDRRRGHPALTSERSSVGKRDQAISRELRAIVPTDTTDVDEQQQQATGQTEGTVVASESKQLVESQAADVDEQATAASS